MINDLQSLLNTRAMAVEALGAYLSSSSGFWSAFQAALMAEDQRLFRRPRSWDLESVVYEDIGQSEGNLWVTVGLAFKIAQRRGEKSQVFSETWVYPLTLETDYSSEAFNAWLAAQPMRLLTGAPGLSDRLAGRIATVLPESEAKA